MSHLLWAALLCAPASAQVFETRGTAAAPVAPVSGAIAPAMGPAATLSPISAVPGALVLAPSLGAAAIPAPPASAVRFAPAPIPALPAAAASSAAKASAAPSRRGPLPPAGSPPEASASRLGADNGEYAAPLGGFDRLSAEGAAAFARKAFDRDGGRAPLAGGPAAGAPGALATPPFSAVGRFSAARDPLLAASAGASAEGEALRDAIAAPIPAAAAPGAAFSFFRVPGSLSAPSRNAVRPSAPAAFERLSVELGSGLVVKVRAALGLAAASAPAALPAFRASGAGVEAAASPRPARAPITSTEWLERRGLLESLSASEAAASQEAASLPAAARVRERASAPGLAPAAAPRVAVPAARVLDLVRPAGVPAAAWWALAFLPAALVALKELL